MDPAEKIFHDCINAFTDHDYERAANIALNAFQQRRFFWVVQLLLISLERAGRRGLGDFTEYAYGPFSAHPWELALIDVIVGRKNSAELRGHSLDAVQRCQLEFYEAHRHLTLGNRWAAAVGFSACAMSGVPRLEAQLADRECNNPEPADLVLERVIRHATYPETGLVRYDLLTAAHSVLQLSGEDLQVPSMALPCLEIILMKLRPIEGDADVASVRSKLEALYADRDREWRSLGV